LVVAPIIGKATQQIAQLKVGKGCYAIKHGTVQTEQNFDVVIAYNGRDHYVPTRSVDERKFNDALAEMQRYLKSAENSLALASYTSDTRYKDNCDDMKRNFKVI
jgi:hypothetical protein